MNVSGLELVYFCLIVKRVKQEDRGLRSEPTSCIR